MDPGLRGDDGKTARGGDDNAAPGRFACKKAHFASEAGHPVDLPVFRATQLAALRLNGY
jgi:hypothetical protein